MTLTPSQRVRLITEISERYSEEAWHLIDLTLQEFGYETSGFGGTRREHIVGVLRANPADEPLIALAKHCGASIPDDIEPSKIDPPFWQPGMFRVFISHLSAHRAAAARLQQAFERYGISCFVAHNDIEPSEEWQLQIETALASCDALIAILHNGFHASNWTDQEIGYVMGRKLPIFTLMIDEAPYGFIGRFQAFAAKGKQPAEVAEEIFRVLLKHKQTHRRMASIAVSFFEKSASFQAAKDRIEYLESLPEGDATLGARIVKAAEENGQIASATDVPARVEALARKWGYKPSVEHSPDDEIPF